MIQALIDAGEQVTNQRAKDALHRLATDKAVAHLWNALPDDAVGKLRAACIFYWDSQSLPNKSTYAKDIDEIERKVVALQRAIRTTFGVGDELLSIELEKFRVRLGTQAKEAYNSFYAVPRQLLLDRLYSLTSNFAKPNHDLIATLASVITGDVIAVTDIQSTYRNLKLAKTQSKK